MAQQLLAAHVTGSAGDRSAGIRARTTQVDVVQTSKTIEVRCRIVRVVSVEKCLPAN